jgi:hypothetical protein
MTAIVGVALAFHGWIAARSGNVSGAVGSLSPSATARAAHGSGGSAAAAPGPKLGSQSYASYSFLVWPGPPSAAARTAMTGLSISVHRTSSGISVRAGVKGRPRAAAHLYRKGARVYVVEASLGDEAGHTDYNLGDDGVVVTDAHGRIVR